MKILIYSRLEDLREKLFFIEKQTELILFAMRCQKSDDDDDNLSLVISICFVMPKHAKVHEANSRGFLGSKPKTEMFSFFRGNFSISILIGAGTVKRKWLHNVQSDFFTVILVGDIDIINIIIVIVIF